MDWSNISCLSNSSVEIECGDNGGCGFEVIEKAGKK